MIGKLNHVAIVVPDIDEALRVYRETLGARVSARRLSLAANVDLVKRRNLEQL